ncbi:MAG: GumN family protein [Verrucomicrobiaceae bacterium]|nr:GumN family protein [Verrucomicrobiaceae bacterium]
MPLHRVKQLLTAALTLVILQAPLVRAADCLPLPQAPTPEVMQQLAATAQDRGFLWKLSKDGHDSWLYGTMHVGKLDWIMPGPLVSSAMRSSEVFALELDPTDPATVQKLAELSQQGAGQIPAALRPRLKKQLEAVCMAESAIDQFNPILLLSTIEVQALRKQGLEFAYGVESVLIGYARTAHKKIIPLETAESQMAALLGDDGKVDMVEFEAALTELEKDGAQTVADRLALAWAQGDIADLQRYENWCDCLNTPIQREEMKRLLDDRNGPLADSIDALHRQGKPIFVGVGALHMMGVQGLPALLQRKGYVVLPIAFNVVNSDPKK